LLRRRQRVHNGVREFKFAQEPIMRRQDTSNRNADEEVLSDTVTFRGLMRYEQQSPMRQISYYLCGEILEPQYYTEMFYTLRTAAEGDVIYLHLNSSGGDFNSGLQMINNIAASPATVVTLLEARAYSMAALIFLAGDKLVVHDNCQLMFHIYSGYFAGKGNEQQAEVIAIGKWFEKVMARICVPFLSEGEIGRILKGSDLWMDSDEISHRLSRVLHSRVAKKTPPKRVSRAVPAAPAERVSAAKD
jgi:ATP-dependent Clp protease protease subunit